MSTLFSPFRIGSLELGNRIVVSPMCQYSADEGQAVDWHLIHLGQLAVSGAGLLFVEATAVEPEGRITPGDLGLWSDATEVALAKVLGAIRRYAPIRVGIQLAHAGRKASSQRPWDGGQCLRPEQGAWPTVAPSALPHAAGEPVPSALDDDGLRRIREAFAGAARRAAAIGVDVVELHLAHGYLLHQFLSPLANLRTDAYGGPLQNRMRFPLEVFTAIRDVLPAGVPLGVRLSATDWVDGGWYLEQSLVLVHELATRGCAFVDVSSGGVSPLQRIPVGPGYQVGFASRIRRETGMPTIAVGMITTPEQAETIVASGQADLVALARGMLYDPRWPWHAAAALGATVVAPCPYWRSQPRLHPTLFGDIRQGQR